MRSKLFFKKMCKYFSFFIFPTIFTINFDLGVFYIFFRLLYGPFFNIWRNGKNRCLSIAKSHFPPNITKLEKIEKKGKFSSLFPSFSRMSLDCDTAKNSNLSPYEPCAKRYDIKQKIIKWGSRQVCLSNAVNISFFGNLAIQYLGDTLRFEIPCKKQPGPVWDIKEQSTQQIRVDTWNSEIPANPQQNTGGNGGTVSRQQLIFILEIC